MPLMTIQIGGNVRATNQRLPNISVQGNVTGGYYDERGNKGNWNDTLKGIVSRSPLSTYNDPTWSNDTNMGVASHFARHNSFNDQERYNRQSMGYVKRQGTFVKYYVTSFEPFTDPLYKEDANRRVERVFDVPLILTFQPENELFSRFGVQHVDEFDAHIHMSLFLELNYANLKKYCITPACDPSVHNPQYYQRGYDSFSYHGYSLQQMMPKAGDLIKIEAYNKLYTIESVLDSSPEYQYKWHKYWWKVFIKDAMDNGMTVDQEVLGDSEQKGFINDLLNTQDMDNPNYSQYPLDVSCTVDQLKKDIIFRPPQVDKSVEDPTCDNKWYPCGDLMGTW